jgi:hypothetical protein
MPFTERAHNSNPKDHLYRATCSHQKSTTWKLETQWSSRGFYCFAGCARSRHALRFRVCGVALSTRLSCTCTSRAGETRSRALAVALFFNYLCVPCRVFPVVAKAAGPARTTPRPPARACMCCSPLLGALGDLRDHLSQYMCSTPCSVLFGSLTTSGVSASFISASGIATGNRNYAAIKSAVEIMTHSARLHLATEASTASGFGSLTSSSTTESNSSF